MMNYTWEEQSQGNLDEGLQRLCRANRSLILVYRAKDLSNHLVGGSLWSVPRDSWNCEVLRDKANDSRYQGHVVLDLCLNVNWVSSISCLVICWRNCWSMWDIFGKQNLR